MAGADYINVGVEIVDEIEVGVSVNTLVGAEPLKTGQTTSYADNDDGDLEKGQERSYSVLSTGQYAGTTDITVNGKTVSLSNNCVRDNKTRLMWARYVPQSDIGPDANGKLYWYDAVNSEDAFEFAAAANTAELGGHSDWHVPNRIQINTIFDAGEYNPCIDTTTFPSTPAAYTWTSTTMPGNANVGYNISFVDGVVSYANKSGGKCYVRLVRDV